MKLEKHIKNLYYNTIRIKGVIKMTFKQYKMLTRVLKMQKQRQSRISHLINLFLRQMLIHVLLLTHRQKLIILILINILKTLSIITKINKILNRTWIRMNLVNMIRTKMTSIFLHRHRHIRLEEVFSIIRFMEIIHFRDSDLVQEKNQKFI